jgi:hypothetical protein
MGSNTLLIAPIIAHQRRLGVLPLADPLRRIREFHPIVALPLATALCTASSAC